MTTLFIILVVLASAVLALIVLIQNPKGGGLSGNIAGFSNQFMGVKQTTDVLEKGTWVFGGVVAILCLVSVMFISSGTSTTNEAQGAQAPVNNTKPSTVLPGAPAPGTNTAPATTPGGTAPVTTPK
jgi:preprotein translocase subunit SecG